MTDLKTPAGILRVNFVSSSSCTSLNDQTLLLNARMNQFKPIFFGENVSLVFLGLVYLVQLIVRSVSVLVVNTILERDGGIIPIDS